MSKRIEEKDEDPKNESKVQLARILIPIDGSDYSMKAAKYAVEIASIQKAQLFCIYVLDKLPYGYEISGYGIEDYLQNIENQANLWFKDIQMIAQEKEIKNPKSEILRDFRSIVDSIINYASIHNIDLIVIGTRGRTGLQRVLLGSVANGVSQHAHCPVLLVR